MLYRKTYKSGQGVLEALILIFGVIFIFAIALPNISSRAASLKKKNQLALTKEEPSENQNSPLCGEIIIIPSAQGKAPFRVFLVGTEKRGKYKVSGFRWDFTGDNVWDTEISQEPQNHVFEVPQEYNLKMQVIDEKGNTRTCARKIKVLP